MDKDWLNYRRYLAGEDEGLTELIRDHRDSLTFFLMCYVSNFHTAEELCEEVFFRLAVKKPLFQPRAAFKTWLFTLGHNLAVSYLRRAGREAPLTVDLPDERAGLEERLLREERKKLLHKTLGRLNPDYARVLHLKYFEDLSNEEAAKVLGKSRRQVENLTFQAKKALKAELQKEGFSHEDL